MGLISPEERVLLNGIMQSDTEKIDDFFAASNLVSKAFDKKIYTEEENEFLQKNRFEFHWQILNLWIIHHHNFILGPINEYVLGKDFNHIFMQYGWLNVIFLKNMMEFLGGISYNNYFISLFSFYFIYYTCFVGTVFMIFRRLVYTLIVTALAFAAFNAIGFQFLFLGPGMNPIRHLFDIFVLLLLYRYCVQGRRKDLLVSSILCFAAILNNSQFGLFLLIALVVSLATKYLKEGYKLYYRETLFLIMVVAIGLGLFFSL
ncbi:MAG: hypothetical protein H6Q65_586 [Firmicutes bacterium]|nr:hypothetical protein [Bacillota bacterium]